MILTPTPTQEKHADYLYGRQKACDFSEPGTGKTLTAITALKKVMANGHVHRCRTLIIVPTIVRQQWFDQIQDHFPVYNNVMIKHGRQMFDDSTNIIVITYGLAKAGVMNGRLREWSPDVVILDEAHALKTPTSKATTMIFGTPTIEGLVKRATWVWALTGTPVRRYPDDLYPLMSTLFPLELGISRGKVMSYDSFVDVFCQWEMRKYGNMYRAQKTVTGAKNISTLQGKVKAISVRRSLQEMVKELPAVTHSTINVGVSEKDILAALFEENPKLAAAYATSEAALADMMLDMIKAGDAHLASMRAELGRQKGQAKELAEYIKDLEGPTLVFAWHHDAMDMLQDQLKSKSVRRIDGNKSHKQRDIIMRDFKDGRVDVLIGQIAAMGTGLDGLQHRCNHAIFLEQDWSPAVNEQAVARLNRMGQILPVHVDVVVADTFIDHLVYETVKRKTEIAEQLI